MGGTVRGRGGELDSNRRVERRSPLLHLGHRDDMEEMTMLDHDACWEAVVGRDAGADGRFLY